MISIAIHYFFTVCFTFMFLEGEQSTSLVQCSLCIHCAGIYMYSLVASVVKGRGMLATKQVKPLVMILLMRCFNIPNILQNIFVGWGLPAFIILFNMCFEYDNYGGTYHCWLQMDQGLMYGQYVPIVVLVVSTFTLVEAAGAADEYPELSGASKVIKLSLFR